MVKRVVFVVGSILFFLAGCLLYGVFLNYSQKTLNEEMYSKGIRTISNPIIKIDRKRYALHLFQDTTFIKSYRAVFGRNSEAKRAANDRATPIGEYRICRIDSTHLYYCYLHLNYPNEHDITEAYRRNELNREEFEATRNSFFYQQMPDQNTVLGGNIGIHGIGKLNFLFKNLPFVFNWTDGSIAISNEDMNEILPIIKIGTNVIIY
ncbi:MAG: L,D-transpeptidase [Ignavibacteria bacterium]|nr:L,D-transpeptidase [Ignavibacteria bacterium]